MALTIDDLQPKDFTIKIGGELELKCKPPTLSHILILNKLGDVFQNSNKYDRVAINKAEQDFEWVVSDLVPELRGKKISFNYITDIITGIMENVAPDETKELEELGVKIDADPKAGGRG